LTDRSLTQHYWLCLTTAWSQCCTQKRCQNLQFIY